MGRDAVGVESALMVLESAERIRSTWLQLLCLFHVACCQGLKSVLSFIVGFLGRAGLGPQTGNINEPPMCDICCGWGSGLSTCAWGAPSHADLGAHAPAHAREHLSAGRIPCTVCVRMLSVRARVWVQVLGTGGDVDVTKLSMEESKFLGGDLEHTHLVRGLDYALLQKVRVHTQLALSLHWAGACTRHAGTLAVSATPVCFLSAVGQPYPRPFTAPVCLCCVCGLARARRC